MVSPYRASAGREPVQRERALLRAGARVCAAALSAVWVITELAVRGVVDVLVALLGLGLVVVVYSLICWRFVGW